MNILHRQGDIIAERYQIVTTIGAGGMATTYAAVDMHNSQRVALKVVSLLQASDWKNLELFQREAKVLANLHHDFIPKYLDYFELDGDFIDSSDRKFYLVQELIEGESFTQLIARNWQPTETEVKDIAGKLLDILVYLHSLTPPVIHRDIKPQNIIRDDLGNIYLVDFGAVQAVYRNTISVSGTFVGTLGYMSPEQLRGNVVPASDLYSLGCSLIFLLTKKIPTELPQKRMIIDFRGEGNVSENFAAWLDKLIKPAVEDRFQSASMALDALKHYKKANFARNSAISSHISDRIRVKQETDSLHLEITAREFSCLHSLFISVGVMWSFVGGSIFYTEQDSFAATFFAAGILILLSTIAYSRYFLQKKTSLEINPQYFYWKWTEFALTKGAVNKEIKGFTKDINWVNINVDRRSKENTFINTCAIQEGDRIYKFGENYQLSLPEVEYVTQEISAFLKEIN